jgi:hypothetical protein
MVRFGYENGDQKPLNKSPDNQDIESPTPICVIVDEPSNDRSEFWSHTIILSAMDTSKT